MTDHDGGGSFPAPTFLIECYWPGVGMEVAVAAAAPVERACAEAQAEGKEVRVRFSALIPADEAVLFWLESPDDRAVDHVYQRAGVVYDRATVVVPLAGCIRAVAGAVLNAAGYAVADIANALRSFFDTSVSDVANILTGLGSSTSRIDAFGGDLSSFGQSVSSCFTSLFTNC